MTIPEAISRLMKEEGYTTSSFAKLMGVSYFTVYMWKSGRQGTPLKRLKEIAVACDRTLDMQVSKAGIKAKFLLKETIRELSFDQKLRECEMPLRRFCRNHLCFNDDDVKDLVQDTFYAALKNHGTLYPEVAMLTWLIGIAKNISKKKTSKLVYVESYIETDHITDEIESFFRENGDVFRFIEKLTPKRREAYKLALIGLPYKEIAARLQTTEGCIKAIMQQNKIRLKKMIEKETLCNSN